MDKPIISIIVPVYNVEKYVSRSIESILRQTISAMELIIIDDGSTDTSKSIIERYKKSDNRIVTIYQNNRGVSAARNRGIEIAKGKYIGFVDADDYIEPEMFKNIISKMETTQSDLGCCSWNDVHKDGIKKHVIMNLPEKMDRNEFVRHLFDAPRTILQSVWNKVFIKEKIKNLFNENIRICEDSVFLLDYCRNIEKGCVLYGCYYNVNIREGSATRSNIETLAEGLDVRINIINTARDIDYIAGMMAERDFLNNCIILLRELKKEKNLTCYDSTRHKFRDYYEDNKKSINANAYISNKMRFLCFVYKYIY